MSTNNKELLFCPLGGVGEIGANMSLYGYGEKNFHEWIMIDIGVTFTDDSVPGIDLVVPDPDFIIQKIPFTEFYINYFFESMRNVFEIWKNLISSY